MEKKIKYKSIVNKNDFRKLLSKLTSRKLIGIDTETTSVDAVNTELVGISLAIPGLSTAYYIPLKHYGCKQLESNFVLNSLKPVLESKNCIKVGYNIKFDYIVLYRRGITLENIHDVQVMDYLLYPNEVKRDLNSVSLRHLGIGKSSLKDILKAVKKETKKKEVTMKDVSLDVATSYAAHDAFLTLELYPVLLEKLKKEIYWNFMKIIERPLNSYFG